MSDSRFERIEEKLDKILDHQIENRVEIGKLKIWQRIVSALGAVVLTLTGWWLKK